MVKFYTTNYTYNYDFPTVCLAYFLRYPNPYASHVLSTDVIDRNFDPESQRLTTTRLHLKRSRLPRAVVALLPRNILGSMRGDTASANTPANETKSYILETSTVDMKRGIMTTESRNLEWTGVLSVVEKQDYFAQGKSLKEIVEGQNTDSTTTVALTSTLGQRIRRRYSRSIASPNSDDSTASEDEPQKIGFFRSWGQAGIQRSIEAIGLSRTTKSQPNAREGLKIVLERLRSGGLVAVLEGMRRDGELGAGMLAGGSEE